MATVTSCGKSQPSRFTGVLRPALTFLTLLLSERAPQPRGRPAAPGVPARPLFSRRVTWAVCLTHLSCLCYFPSYAVRVCRFIAVLGPDCRPPVVSFSVSDVNTESVSFSALFLASQPPLRGARVHGASRGVCAWRAPGAGRSSAFSVSAFPWK